MAIIANNIRISLSSKITQNQSFDLTSLFLRGPFSSEDLFNSYRNDLNYADADQEISHVLFGDTGLLLDPFDDLNIVVYEDVKPDLI